MNTAKILYNLKFNQRFLLSLWRIPKLRRTFLSEAYHCQEAWNNRLKSSLLTKINATQFYFDLNNKLETKNIISALDVDIFTNCIQKSGFANEISTLLHQLRLTAETSNTLDSTHHAVIRYFIDVSENIKEFYLSIFLLYKKYYYECLERNDFIYIYIYIYMYTIF
jgi:hypothetical protein